MTFNDPPKVAPSQFYLDATRKMEEFVRKLQAEQLRTIVPYVRSLPDISAEGPDPLGSTWNSRKWDEDLVAALCVAIGSMIENILWSCGTHDNRTYATLRIQDGSTGIDAVALAGSRYARGESKILRFSKEESAFFLAQYCGLGRLQALFAWQTIAPLLNGCGESIHGLAFTALPSGDVRADHRLDDEE